MYKMFFLIVLSPYLFLNTRFSHWQLKLKKKSKYDISDGEEDELEIQGGSQFLGNDDFEDEVQLDEEDEDEIENESKHSFLFSLSISCYVQVL